MYLHQNMAHQTTTPGTFASTLLSSEWDDNWNDSTTQATETSTNYLDKHENQTINHLLLSAAAVCLIFSGMSFVAINRTHNIPRTACFLSSTLLIFDCATTFTYATRKLVTDSDTLNVITMIGLGWSYASFINVAVMAMERLLVFQWPYFYMRHVSHSTCTKVLSAIMVLYLGAWTSEWVVCFFTRTGFWNIRRCLDPVVIKYMTATFATLAIVTTTCFMKILFIIIKQRRKVLPQSESTARNHRSTIVVFLCCLNYIFTAVINIVLVYTLAQITIVVRRTILDVLYIVNGLVDTCVYVLWYKECRYELLKIMSICIPPLRLKAERMRVEIFDIMGHQQATDSRTTDNWAAVVAPDIQET